MKDFEVFFKANSAIMILIDAETGNIADANKAALKFYGYSYKKMCSLNISEINTLSKTEIKKQISGILNGKIVTAFYKHKTAGHSIKDIQAFISSVSIDGRKYIYGIIQDVTQFKIKENESSRFKKIADRSISFVGIANMKREVFYLNKAMRKAFAVPENADLSKYKADDFYTDKGKKIIKKVIAKIKGLGYWKGEGEMQSLDGRIYQVLETIVLIRDEAGKPQYTSITAIDITQQKKAELKIENTASRYKTLLENSGEGIHVLDSNLKLLDANNSFCKMLGYSKREALKLSVADWDLQWTNKGLKKRLNDLMIQPAVFETRYRRKDGTLIDVEINAKGVLTDGQRYLYASARDITLRRKMDAAVKESFEQLKKIASNIPGVVYQFRLKPDGTVSFPYASDAITKIYHVDPEAVKKDASKVFERLYPDDFTHVFASTQKSARELSVWKDEFRVIFEDGSVHWLFGNASPQKEEDGSILWHGFVTDITDHKKLQADVERANEKLEMAMDQANLAYWKISAHSQVFTFNDRFYKLYNTTAETEGGYQMSADRYIRRFLFPEDVDYVRGEMLKLLTKENTKLQFEHRIKTNDEKTRYVQVRVNVLVDKNGIVTGAYGCNQDITEFKLAEIALRKSQEKHSDLLKLMDSVFENVPGLLFIKDCNNNFIKVNKSVANGYGKEMEAVNGKNLAAFHTRKDAAKFYKDDLDIINSGIPKLNIEESWPTTEGMKWLTTSKIPYTNFNGKTIGVIGMSMDITARKQLEMALRTSEEKLKQAELIGKFGYWELNLDTQIFDFSTGFAKIYGLESNQVSWGELKKMRLPQYSKVMDDAMKALIEDDKPFDVEYEIKRPKDTEIVGIHIISKYNNTKRIVFGSVQDITEKRKKEKEILRLNNELKELASHLQRLRADERNKLALEVHDKIGQRLVGIKFEIDFIKEHIREDNPEHENKIRSISDEIAEMLKDFNTIYTEVNPTFIDDLSLFDAIDSLAIEYRKKNNLKIKFTTNIENEKFSHETKWNIYKIMEECLSNICTHSKAKNVKIKLLKTGGQLQAEVEDDGTGFDISKLNVSKQIGIIEMRERVNAAGGVLIFDSVQGRGTHIRITISNL